MLATENRTRSRIKRILAIALPIVGRQIRTIRVHGAILVALLGLVVSGFSQTTVSTGGVQGTVTDPILEKIGKEPEPRRANHSGFRSMMASLGEASPSRAWTIVPVFIVSTYISTPIKGKRSQAIRRS